MASVFSINVNKNGGVPKNSIDKTFIGKYGVKGDKQNDLVNHGGKDRAVCLYSLEIIHLLQKEEHPIFAGSTGENITIKGLDWKSMNPGQKISIGNAVIKLTRPTPPCKTIKDSFKDNYFNRISEKIYPGYSRWYAMVIKEGWVSKNDKVVIN